ncbi:GIY-YIG nuclease family protein [Treponema denticola]|uniref:GIY-YIG nuclease family protein n=1 Tax=Treponema denticola TaxID=158 RepID=UPI003D8EC747
MKHVKIYWEEIDSFSIDEMDNYSNLEKKLKEIVDDSDSKILDKNGLYAIIADNNQILYIGETHEQTIGERLVEHHYSYEDILNNLYDYEYISVFAGEVIPISQERVTETLIQDAEACLIYKIQPEFNDQNIYTCKNEIKIINMGHFPWRVIYSCDGDEDD